MNPGGTATASKSETQEGPTSSLDASVVFRAHTWGSLDNRTRQFIRFAERGYSRETDFYILARSVDVLLKRQDDRGSFYTDEDYRSGDKVDDQLGAASMLAYFLSQNCAAQEIEEALERAVRFHLDHLVTQPSPSRPFRYIRFFIDRDSGHDPTINLWGLAAGSLLLEYGSPYLAKSTTDELRDVMADMWSFASNDPLRAENPCYNQLLAFCEIGIHYARVIGRTEIIPRMLHYYHQRIRPLRIYDRGYWIYPEFNYWDAHYGVLSWSILEYLFVATGDPAFAEDAEQMALYFSERVSAGGYYWGGSRNNECKMEEFLAVFSKWAVELDLDRLLLPPPSHLWRQLAMDGHWGPGFVKRNAIPLRARETRRALSPTPWHFRSRNASVCLYNDARLHHLSAAGLEIIPAANIQGAGSRLTWLSGNTWKTDPFQVTSPPPSEGHRYYQSKPIQLPDAQGLTAMQRGYTWETIQWWIGTENGILWISQLISHAFLTCDKLRYILGNPVLTQVSNAAVPVTELETAEGIKTDTQGESVSISSGKFLRFGDVFVGATSPLEFGRPSRDAFHTFPLPPGTFLRDFSCSNELRVQLSETPPQVECRDSLFFAVEIGNQAPSLSAHRDPLVWTLKAKSGCFVARQREGIWSYTFETHSGHAELPRIGFRFRT